MVIFSFYFNRVSSFRAVKDDGTYSQLPTDLNKLNREGGKIIGDFNGTSIRFCFNELVRVHPEYINSYWNHWKKEGGKEKFLNLVKEL